jgi:hypothetical protein
MSRGRFVAGVLPRVAHFFVACFFVACSLAQIELKQGSARFKQGSNKAPPGSVLFKTMSCWLSFF